MNTVAVKLAVSLLLLSLCNVHAEEASPPTCASCDSSSCTDASELDCPSGMVWDVCGCCQVCAKTVGERCGRSSECREHLLCIPDSPYSTSQDGTCQVASSCSYGNESFSHGDKWNLDSCTSCECNNGTLNCFQEPCSISSDCPSGKIFIPEGECCPVCSTECQASNGQIYSDGEVWQEGPCKRCRCDGGQSKCTSVQCLAPDCPNPIFLPDECCPFCPEPAAATSSCNFGDEVFADGDTWNFDACTTCECSNGNINCVLQPCSISNCPSGRTFTPEGECCPVCSTECQASDSQIYSDGDTWQDGPCKRCRCDAGFTKCSSVQCEHPNCSTPVFLPDVCCPICPDKESSQPSPSSTPETLTSPPPTPDTNTEEVVLLLELPYMEYQDEERFQVAELRTLLASEGLELVDMTATPNEDSSQTYIRMVLSSSDPDAVGNMSERVTNMMAENTKLMGTVDEEGTSFTLAAVLGTTGFVAVVSLVGISIVAVIFIRKRSRKTKSEDQENQ